MRFDIDTYADNLMLTDDEMQAKGIDRQLRGRIVRLRDIYNYMLRNPLKRDREYVDYIQSAYHDDDGNPISKRRAYDDLEILHAVVGNLQQCSKEWHRWRFNSMIMEGYAIAIAKKDAGAIAKLAGQYAKFNKLDQNDERDHGYDQIPHIRFTFDVESSLGFKRIPNVRSVIDRLIVKYSQTSMAGTAEDAEVVELIDAVSEREKSIDKQIEAHADAAAVS